MYSTIHSDWLVINLQVCTIGSTATTQTGAQSTLGSPNTLDNLKRTASAASCDSCHCCRCVSWVTPLNSVTPTKVSQNSLNSRAKIPQKATLAIIVPYFVGTIKNLVWIHTLECILQSRKAIVCGTGYLHVRPMDYYKINLCLMDCWYMEWIINMKIKNVNLIICIINFLHNLYMH